MYKGSIELARINKYMKLKFNLIIQGDPITIPNQKGYQSKVISQFTYMGSDYLKINPTPYVTVDISESNDKNDGWNSNTQFNLNKACLFLFMEKVKSMIERFQIQELFYNQENHLHVNKTLASTNYEILQTGSKVIKMIHAVVYDPEDKENEYEGICLMINGIDNYCTLTITELRYLYYELGKINMHELSMEIVNTYLILQSNMYRKKPEELKLNKVIPE
jgi:hypothetical protein